MTLFPRKTFADGTDKTFTQADIDAAVKKATEGLFNQDQVNSYMKKEKIENDKRNQKLLDELKQLRDSQTITTQERDTLTGQIKDLESQLMTKEELAKRETQRVTEESKKTVATLTGERDHWQNLHTKATIQNTLRANASEAFNPDQIVMLLENKSKLVPVTEGGKVMGYTVNVQWSDKEGKELLLPVPEAIKQMKEQPERFGNLFKSDAKGGFGGAPIVPAGGGSITPNTFSTAADYRKNRDAIINTVK